MFVEPAVKRGPGRPRKHPLPELLVSNGHTTPHILQPDVEGEGNGPDGPFTAPPPEQRKRGRPRKHPHPASAFEVSAPSYPTKRKPGRPPGTGKHQKAAKAKVTDQEPSANGTGEDSPQTTTTPPPTPGARPPNRRKKNTPSKCAQ
ncbi:hypothetical protein ACKKBF_B00540 [Auxenochlorella protothecoides x Auxenochlorella symbiontica]|uniref:Uncharacterized protein n=1 Tax=Auxenochlorella protothecoides TaxID=3075 RepID=A0A1D2ABS8_AUXPR